MITVIYVIFPAGLLNPVLPHLFKNSFNNGMFRRTSELSYPSLPLTALHTLAKLFHLQRWVIHVCQFTEDLIKASYKSRMASKSVKKTALRKAMFQSVVLARLQCPQYINKTHKCVAQLCINLQTWPVKLCWHLNLCNANRSFHRVSSPEHPECFFPSQVRDIRRILEWKVAPVTVFRL